MPRMLKALVALAAAYTAAALGTPVGIATLPAGTLEHEQVAVIARVLQQSSGLQLRVTTFDSPSAINGAAQNRQVEFAYTSNDEASAALRGADQYKGQPMKDLRVALTVMPFSVGILVRADSGIQRVAELKGRKFPTGWQGFLQGIPLGNALLATDGLSLKDVDAAPAPTLLRAADDFKAGRTAGTLFAIGAPKVAELDAALGGVRFLSLENSPEAQKRMQAVRPEYRLTEVDPAPHLPGVVDRTTLLGYYINVLTHPAVPEEIVYRLVKALHESKAALVSGHPSFEAFTPEGMAIKHLSADYHPGAAKFYKEIGAWKGN